MMRDYPEDLLQVRLSNAMPCGFVMHSSASAIVGLFPVQGSYATGPMIEVPGGTELWDTLYDDWQVRWDNPVTVITRNGPSPA
jgi:hypothetical protein